MAQFMAVLVRMYVCMHVCKYVCCVWVNLHERRDAPMNAFYVKFNCAVTAQENGRGPGYGRVGAYVCMCMPNACLYVCIPKETFSSCIFTYM